MVSLLLHHLSHSSSSDCVWHTDPEPRLCQVHSDLHDLRKQQPCANTQRRPHTQSGSPLCSSLTVGARSSASNAPGLEGCKNVYPPARGVNTLITQRNQGLVVFVPDSFLTVGFYLLGSWRRARVFASPCQRSCLNLRSFSVTYRAAVYIVSISVKCKRVRFA